MRSEADIRKEIAERESLNREHQVTMKGARTGTIQWNSAREAFETNRRIIAVLRWVLGEDLLWE